MKVLFLTRYGQQGASSRMRSLQYVPLLENMGIECTLSSFFDDQQLLDRYHNNRHGFSSAWQSYWQRVVMLMKKRQFDLLWIEKEALPWLPASIESFLLGNVPYVLDFDDAIFHNYDQHPSFLVRGFLGQRIDHLMARAKLVVAGNDYLAERARQAGAKWVEQIPTVVDMKRYHPSAESNTGLFTIGWIGSPSTAKYLLPLETAFSSVCNDFKAQLVFVGSGEIQFKGTPVTTRPWSEKTEVCDIQTFDVGIMPLSNTPWERGKCGFKLIQYMACGIPVVASPVGVNQQIVDHGINGFLASSTDEWIRVLSYLRDNREKCREMGISAREKVEIKYSLQGSAPRLAELLRNAIKNSHSCSG